MKPLLNSLSHLKRVKPIDVKMPKIHKKDVPWSEVFEKISLKFKYKEAPYGLCYEIEEVVEYNQAKRMKCYISDVLQGSLYLTSWLKKTNPEDWIADMDELRYHWCLHLAKQFKNAGY